MAKKVIQVAVDPGLHRSLDERCRKEGKSRSEVIRAACQRYLSRVQDEELDRLYRRGYEVVPEESGLGEAQMARAAQVLPVESW